MPWTKVVSPSKGLIPSYLIIKLVNCIVPINPYAAGGYFSLYKIMQKENWKMAETLAYGYSSDSTQQKLSHEHQHDRV